MYVHGVPCTLALDRNSGDATVVHILNKTKNRFEPLSTESDLPIH